MPFIACIIDSLSIFVCSLDLSNFVSASGLSCFWVLSICLLLVYFVSAAGYHCSDQVLGNSKISLAIRVEIRRF